MNWNVKVEEATRDNKPPPNQISGAACMVGMLDAVVELLAVKEVIEQLFTGVALHCRLQRPKVLEEREKRDLQADDVWITCLFWNYK